MVGVPYFAVLKGISSCPRPKGLFFFFYRPRQYLPPWERYAVPYFDPAQKISSLFNLSTFWQILRALSGKHGANNHVLQPTNASLCQPKIAVGFLLTQMWFYGWGFYALGQDDTLEKQLTGQPTKSQTPPLTIADDIGISSTHGKPPVDTLPQKVGVGRAGSGSIPGAQAPATAGGDGVVVIDIDQCREEDSNIAEVEAASGTNKNGGERGGDGGWTGLKKRILRIVLSPNIIAVAIGVVIAMIAPLQKLLFDNPRAILRPVGAAVEV